MKTIAKRILHRLYRLLTPGSSRTQTMNALASLNATVTALKEELAAIKAELADVRQKMSAPPLPLADSLGAAEEKQPGKAGGRLANDRSAVIRFNKQFLNDHYDLRYNILKRATEFRPKQCSATPAPTVPGVTTAIPGGGAASRVSGGLPAGNTSPASTLPSGGRVRAGASFQPLTDRGLNRITVEQLEAGGASWSYAMKLCIESSEIPCYNPVTAWLDSCPRWDGHDHIGDLARRVPTGYDRWPEFFHRWMLALVAQAKGMSTHGNAMVPLLIGAQGLRKSTFCRALLPPELREYFMDDIKMDSAEQVERVLARMWLVCIDEYNAKTPREQAKIKRLLTEKDVQVRRPRSSEYHLVPRLASFIATTNDPTPLPGGDGTRRYLCVEVEGEISLPGSDGTGDAIDYRQLYAQALAELQQEGCRWWFDADDEAEIQRHNAPYQQTTPLETVLPSIFTPTTNRRRENLWQVHAVQKVLAERLRTADVPNLRQLSDAMKALRWPQGAVCGTRGYYLELRVKS